MITRGITRGRTVAVVVSGIERYIEHMHLYTYKSISVIQIEIEER